MPFRNMNRAAAFLEFGMEIFIGPLFQPFQLLYFIA